MACPDADVGVPRPAQQAPPIDDVSLGRHAIALSDIGDQPADLHDIPGEFVTDDEGRLAPPLRPCIPVVDVNVGAADAGALHANENFVLPDPRLLDILELEPRRR